MFFVMYIHGKKKSYNPEYYQANKERFKLYAAKKLAIKNGTYVVDENAVKQKHKTAYERALLRYAQMEKFHQEKREKFFQQEYNKPSA
jgi:hypothetical protein